jgi:hypothetical protein
MIKTEITVYGKNKAVPGAYIMDALEWTRTGAAHELSADHILVIMKDEPIIKEGVREVYNNGAEGDDTFEVAYDLEIKFTYETYDGLQTSERTAKYLMSGRLLYSDPRKDRQYVERKILEGPALISHSLTLA